MMRNKTVRKILNVVAKSKYKKTYGNLGYKKQGIVRKTALKMIK